MNVAFVINASILVLAAEVFHSAGLPVTDLREAQRLLSPLLGTGLAGLLFAVALLAAGQSSTITGTLAGQVVMQGFLRLRGSPALVRLMTRGIAVFPAVVVLSVLGDDATVPLLVATQVVLSLQLPFALVPLIRFTATRDVMGAYANARAVTSMATVAAALIIACNAWLVMQTIGAALPLVLIVGLVAHCRRLRSGAARLPGVRAAARCSTRKSASRCATSSPALDGRRSASRYNGALHSGR